MKLSHTLLASALVALLSACTNGAPDNAQPAEPAPTTMAPPAAEATTGNAMMSSEPAMTSSAATTASDTSWFGGATYTGEPNLEVTAALVKAGGGASDFSFSKALVSMLGEKTVKSEVAKLTKQYGKADVDKFIDGMTFAVKNGLKRATEAGVKLPTAPADLKGKKLAESLVKAGTAPDGTWWAGYLFDQTLSHDIHVKVMQDIDAKSSHADDENTHKILNQAMFDVAQALDMKDVKLASLH